MTAYVVRPLLCTTAQALVRFDGCYKFKRQGKWHLRTAEGYEYRTDSNDVLVFWEEWQARKALRAALRARLRDLLHDQLQTLKSLWRTLT